MSVSRGRAPSSVRTALICAVWLVVCSAALATAQQPAPAAPAPPHQVTVYARNWTRAEMWRFFEPTPDKGDPQYAFIANRLQLGLERHTKRYDFLGALQYVQLGGLPTAAIAPNPLGPMGTGALYYLHAKKDDGTFTRHPYGVNLRYLNLRLKDLTPGWSLQMGRMAYTSGAESPSGDTKIEAVKRQRVDSKLLGEFEWSHFQRGYDGVRTDVDRKAFHVTAGVLLPTQGGFEDNAFDTITTIKVVTGTAAVKPGPKLRHTDWESFVTWYDDTRAVAARPDNTGLTASAVDVQITTIGTMLIGAYPVNPSHQLDTLFWLALQTGDWYGQSHRAAAVTAEAGLQWTKAAWKPWIRGGFTHATGDDNPADSRHGTFFQVLPTVRKYSLSATYSVMDLNDAFVQILAAPRPTISVRVDLHHLALATAADRWYYGSGATQKKGTIFGYSGRPSQGHTGLGTVAEGSMDYRLNPRWSINGYLGVFNGGDVVAANFTGSEKPLLFGYVENVLQF